MIDLYLITKIIRDKDFIKAKRFGISSKHIHPDFKSLYDFIENHFQIYRTTPSEEIIQEKFGLTLELTVDDPLEVWLKEIALREKHKNVLRLSEKIEISLKQSNIEQAYEEINDFNKKNHELFQTHLISKMGDQSEVLKKDYEDMEQGITGIPTPWHHMNQLTMGWWQGDLSFFAGRLGTGKTFLSLLLATHASSHGHKTLFISGEMSKKDISKRAISLMGKIPLNLIRQGKLSPEMKQNYFKLLDLIQSNQNLEIMDGSFGFSSHEIEQAIEKTNADLIIVDAAYRIQSKKKVRDRFENMAEVANDLKTFALTYHKSIVGTIQLNRGANQKEKYEDSDIAMSDVIGWNATNLFALKQSDELRQKKMMEIHALKIREAEKPLDPMLLNWNFEIMNFNEAHEPKNQQNYSSEKHIPYL